MSRMRAFRLKIALVACLALGIAALVYVGRRDLRRSAYAHDKLSLLARFVAKEYCSCRFVDEQTAEYCDDYVATSIPLFGFRINTGAVTSHRLADVPPGSPYSQSVRASALFVAKAEARFYGEIGCRLEP